MKREKVKYQDNHSATITLNTCIYNGIQYGAGACGVSLGGHPMAAVAVKAGRHRHITHAHSAIEWLIGHGCHRGLATDLVGEAVQFPEINPIPHDQRTACFVTREHPMADVLLHMREDLREIRKHFESARELTDRRKDPRKFAYLEQKIDEMGDAISRADTIGKLWVLNWPTVAEVTNG